MFFVLVYLDNIMLVLFQHVVQGLTQLSSPPKITQGLDTRNCCPSPWPWEMAIPAAGGHTSISGLPAGSSVSFPCQSWVLCHVCVYPNAICPTVALTLCHFYLYCGMWSSPNKDIILSPFHAFPWKFNHKHLRCPRLPVVSYGRRTSVEHPVSGFQIKEARQEKEMKAMLLHVTDDLEDHWWNWTGCCLHCLLVFCILLD